MEEISSAHGEVMVETCRKRRENEKHDVSSKWKNKHSQVSSETRVNLSHGIGLAG